MTTTIVQSDNLISVKSPYSRDFAYAARAYGGNWNREEKLWQFDATQGFSVTSLQSFCQRFYPSVEVADAFPVPEVPAALPDFGFFGTVGATVTVDLEITKTVDLNGQYGTSRLHIMKDAENHVFTWYAATARYEAGTSVRLTGKVKNHTTYKNVSQTVLTRCKKV